MIPASDLNFPIKLTAIVAMDKNRVIGYQGKTPWHYPEDLQFFKRTTLNHAILMGRTTLEAIGRPLPKRTNVILSRTLPKRDDMLIVHGLAEALLWLRNQPRAFVIGGAQVYEQMLPYCDQVIVTLVPGTHAGDVFMPPFESEFDLVSEDVTSHASPAQLHFRRYQRRTEEEFHQEFLGMPSKIETSPSRP